MDIEETGVNGHMTSYHLYTDVSSKDHQMESEVTVSKLINLQLYKFPPDYSKTETDY